MEWHGKRRVEPEDIAALRQLERMDKAMAEQRPLVERMWEEILKSLQNPWRR